MGPADGILVGHPVGPGHHPHRGGRPVAEMAGRAVGPMDGGRRRRRAARTEFPRTTSAARRRRLNACISMLRMEIRRCLSAVASSPASRRAGRRRQMGGSRASQHPHPHLRERHDNAGKGGSP